MKKHVLREVKEVERLPDRKVEQTEGERNLFTLFVKRLYVKYCYL